MSHTEINLSPEELFKPAGLYKQDGGFIERISTLTNSAILIAAMLFIILSVLLNIFALGINQEVSAQPHFKTGRTIILSK